MTIRSFLAVSVLALAGIGMSAQAAESVGDSAASAAKKTGRTQDRPRGAQGNRQGEVRRQARFGELSVDDRRVR